MKKIVCLFLSVFMIMLLVACSISENAEDAEDKIITELENVTLNSLDVDGVIKDNDSISLSTSIKTDVAPKNTEPTAVPTEAPISVPAVEQAVEPTKVPTEAPTEIPTPLPTENPTPNPTQRPTLEPTIEPNNNLIEVLTPASTPITTVMPTAIPTEAPSVTPVPTIEPAKTEAPVVCEHKNVEQHYDYWGPPTCQQGSTLYTCCIDCEECLYWEHFPPLPHEPDEDDWNEKNICKYWTAGSGAVIQIKCKCGVTLENRPVTATHNYVPTRVFQEVITWDYSAEGFGVSQTGYDVQEYECTECGKTYTDIIKEYDIVDGEWIEY